MPINPDLLIAAPVLQDSLVDKDGTPMSAGTITCYQDNSRTTLKNWYYQTGTPGNYTYKTLPNPLTLSAAGTICDINGVDTIPFFYPYSEADQTQAQPYYITIVNYAQTNQITRANFPFNPQENNPEEASSVSNFVINNVFWRNIGTANLTNVLDMTVCPSQHDGFRYPDVHFIKNVTGGDDTLTFTKFPLSSTQALTDDITPEYYINHTCSNTPVGETQKCYQFPISLHVATLSSVEYTVTIQAQNAGGTATGQNVIDLFILQDTGTGTSSPAPFLIGSITLNTAWTKYEFTTVFPSTAGLTLGNGGDDALYLQVQMPLNIACEINFTKPSIYLTNTAPTNSFATYDEIDAIINSPRTGDLRNSINSFYPYGWVPMNDGAIGNASSNANTRSNQDTWQLYNLLWTLAKPYDTGSTFNALCQLYNSSGSAINYGSSAIADFNANNALGLTKMFGRVLMGTVPISALLANQSGTISATNVGGNLFITPSGFTNTSDIYTGQTITFTTTGSLPGNLSATAVYYIAGFNGTGFNVSTTYANALAGTVIAYSSAGSNSSASIQLSGSTLGQYQHTMLVTEMPSHTHPPLSPSTGFVVLNGAGASGVPAGAGVEADATTGATGGGAAFNILQPATFYNVYIKL